MGSNPWCLFCTLYMCTQICIITIIIILIIIIIIIIIYIIINNNNNILVLHVSSTLMFAFYRST